IVAAHATTRIAAGTAPSAIHARRIAAWSRRNIAGTVRYARRVMKRAGVVISRRDAALMIGLIVVGGLVTILWGERIGVNDGKGWDGQAYVAWARDFPDWVRAGVTTYQSQRMAPSAIIYGALTVLDVAPTDAHILVAFQVLDLVALVVSALALI